jgi:uncharacterized protein YndB with AHSA1/START domain
MRLLRKEAKTKVKGRNKLNGRLRKRRSSGSLEKVLEIRSPHHLRYTWRLLDGVEQFVFYSWRSVLFFLFFVFCKHASLVVWCNFEILV